MTSAPVAAPSASITLTGTLMALAAKLVTAVLFGRIAQGIGQPRVLGLMVAGVILGPSLLDHFAPDALMRLFSDDVRAMLGSAGSLILTIVFIGACALTMPKLIAPLARRPETAGRVGKGAMAALVVIVGLDAGVLNDVMFSSMGSWRS